MDGAYTPRVSNADTVAISRGNNNRGQQIGFSSSTGVRTSSSTAFLTLLCPNLVEVVTPIHLASRSVIVARSIVPQVILSTHNAGQKTQQHDHNSNPHKKLLEQNKKRISPLQGNTVVVRIPYISVRIYCNNFFLDIIYVLS